MRRGPRSIVPAESDMAPAEIGIEVSEVSEINESGSSKGLQGLTVMSVESRQSEEMGRMIARFGGSPLLCPSMSEAPKLDNPLAVDFAHTIITGGFDSVVLLTGVGFRYFLEQVQRRVDFARLLGCLADIPLICRGPKPVAALREHGLKPSLVAPEPNTWRELLTAMDGLRNLANSNIGLIEYGASNRSLIAGLESRGAQVTSLKVYEWQPPEDISKLEQGVRAIVSGGVDVLLFTSAQQAHNLLKTAEDLNLLSELREGLRGLVVGSIGPTTSETLRELDLPIDFSPEHPKMGHLLVSASNLASGLLNRKRRLRSLPLQSGNVTANPAADPALNSLFLRACRREPTERTPIWLMRQAGRYLPEYRAIREQSTFLELCKSPERSAEVMITTVRRLNVDAAIIFSDLLPILEPMGFHLEFAQGEGPVIHNPVRESLDVNRVRELDNLESLQFVFDTVRLTKAGLPGVPVIGFAGAPFTLASYALEGGGSKNYLHTKTFMYRDEGAWRELMSRFAKSVARYLIAQIEAGAHAVQLFDSWVGCLSPSDYRRYVAPYSKIVLDAIPAHIPAIHFGAGNPALIGPIAEAGGDVVGVDWRIELSEACRIVGPDRAIQGNLDPMVLLSNPDNIRAQASAILSQARGRRGHIFNLGHGVLPQTPVESVLALIDAVKSHTIAS